MYIDGHCDSLKVALDKKIDMRDLKLEFNFLDAKKMVPCIQICAAYISSEYEDGFKRALDIIGKYKKEKFDTILVENRKNIEQIVANEDIGILLSIENGKAIENNLNNVDILYDLGIRMMGITWNDDNLLGCGALTQKDTGLTDFGKDYIKKLDLKNIIIDISHCSKNTFWDVCNETSGTIVASHSCCKSLCNHNRNLDDEQIKEIAKRGGIIGICFASPFLNENEIASSNDIVNHIKYVIDLVGIDYVGLGSDFDGVSLANKVSDVKNLNDIKIIRNKLEKSGYSKEEIDKIMGENWLRIIKNKI